MAIEPSGIVTPGPSEFTCRAEFDVNSAASFRQEIPAPKLQDLFRELQTYAAELATNGDVP